MTRKDYELIAAVLKSELEIANAVYAASVRNLAYTFADRLASDNPKFDREKFLNAVLR